MDRRLLMMPVVKLGIFILFEEMAENTILLCDKLKDEVLFKSSQSIMINNKPNRPTMRPPCSTCSVVRFSERSELCESFFHLDFFVAFCFGIDPERVR